MSHCLCSSFDLVICQKLTSLVRGKWNMRMLPSHTQIMCWYCLLCHMKSHTGSDLRYCCCVVLCQICKCMCLYLTLVAMSRPTHAAVFHMENLPLHKPLCCINFSYGWILFILQTLKSLYDAWYLVEASSGTNWG